MTQRVEIKLGPTSGPGNHVVIDGVDVVNQIASLSVSVERNGPPVLTLDYLCVAGLDFNGEAVVHHYCPIAEEDSTSDAA